MGIAPPDAAGQLLHQASRVQQLREPHQQGMLLRGCLQAPGSFLWAGSCCLRVCQMSLHVQALAGGAG